MSRFIGTTPNGFSDLNNQPNRWLNGPPEGQWHIVVDGMYEDLTELWVCRDLEDGTPRQDITLHLNRAQVAELAAKLIEAHRWAADTIDDPQLWVCHCGRVYLSADMAQCHKCDEIVERAARYYADHPDDPDATRFWDMNPQLARPDQETSSDPS